MIRGKIVKGMCVIAMAIMLLGADPASPIVESIGIVQEVEAASVGLSKSSVTLKAKEKYTVTLKGVASKQKKKVTWKASSKNVVVSYNKKDARKATFYAKKAGNYKVTATYGKKKYTITVRAESINKTSLTLAKGKKYTLKLSNTKGKAKWSSSKKSVIAVKASSNGKSAVITAKKSGKATITATVDGKKLTCVVKVKGTTAVVTPKPNPTTAPKPTESPKPQPTEAPKPTETPNPTPTEAVKPTPEPTPVVVLATGITLDDNKIKLDKDCFTWELKSKVEPKNSTQKGVVWESDNTKVVTVSNYGELTAMGNGTAKVRCYVKENRSIYAECVVTVDLSSKEQETKPEPTKPVEPKPTEPEVVKVSGITLNPDIDLKIEEGSSYAIKATVAPSNATNNSVKWVSSSPDVATVDDNGNVTALKAGSTTITCTAVDGSGVSASCTVTVKAKSTTTNPSEQDKTDPTYTFKVRGGSLKSKSVFNGGDLANILITTDAPINKLEIITSNDGIQYNALNYNSEYNYYSFSLYARRKTESCKVSIILDGKQVWSKDIVIVSDDQNWATYESWLNSVLENIKGSNSDFDKLNHIQKITLLGQYILDNYDYNVDPNKSFHNHGCGNCNASAFVLKDYAQRLGLKAEVVTPKMYAGNVSTSSHVVAKVCYDGKIYHIDAGLGGKAPRGKISIMYWEANEYNG